MLSDDIQQDLQTLLGGKNITEKLHKEIAFEEIEERKDTLYSLLVFAGYLNPNPNNQSGLYDLTIPNQEIRQIYEEKIIERITRQLNISTGDYAKFVNSLKEEKIEKFTENLGNILVKYGSHHDLTKEESYHNLMTGLFVPLSDNYLVISNHESGHGRYDHALIPLANKLRKTAFIFEYKKAEKEGNEELDFSAQQGLDQIDEYRYDIGVKQHQQVKRIIKIGLAFRGKKLKARYKIEEKTSDDS